MGRPRNIGSLDLDARGARPSGGLTRFWYVPLGFLVAAAIAYGVVWAIDYLRDDGGGADEPAAPATTVVPTATATPIPTATPTPLPPTPTPPPTPVPTAQPSARFSPGESVVVAGTDSCLNVRAEADIEGQILDCLADGTIVTVLEGPEAQGNLNWWLIAAPEVNGWAAELYLAKR